MLVDDKCELWHYTLDLAIRAAREVDSIRKFTLVTVWQPIEENNAALKKFFGDIDQVKLMGPDFKNQDINAFFKQMRCHVDGKVETILIYLSDNLITGIWLSLFPQATINVQYFPIEQLHEVFKERLLKPYIPQDGAERGRQEVLFNGIHRFAAEGISMGKAPEPDETKFTEVPETPVNLEVGPAPKGQDCGMGKCPHGCYFNERTRWFKAGEPIPPHGFVDYEKVAPKLQAG